MSLSFPVAPTDGQQYQNWVWSSAVGAWQPNFAAGFVTGFNGRAGAVTFQPSDNTSGNKVLLMKQTVSAPVAAVDFFGASMFDPTKYDEVELSIWDISYAADQTTPYLQISADGSTVVVTASYNSSYQFVASNSSSSYAGTNSVASMQMAPYGTTLAIGGTFQGCVRVRLATVNPSPMTWLLCSNNAAAQIATYGGGYSTAVSTPKGLRFTTDKGAGAITRGTLALYGVLK